MVQNVNKQSRICELRDVNVEHKMFMKGFFQTRKPVLTAANENKCNYIL